MKAKEQVSTRSSYVLYYKRVYDPHNEKESTESYGTLSKKSRFQY